MAKKQKSDESGLTAAAKAVGSAAGKIAVQVGLTEAAPTAPRIKKGKLQKIEGRQRMPRRQKKAQKKAGGA